MKESTLQITCPTCGNQFSPEAAIESHLRTHLEKEYAERLTANAKTIEEKATAKAFAEFSSKVQALEKETSEKSAKLQTLEQQSIILEQRERDLREKEQRSELEFKKRLLIEEQKIRGEAERAAREKADVEFQEREAKLKRQQESIEVSIKKAAFVEVEKVQEQARLEQAELNSKLDTYAKMVEEMKRKGAQGSMQLQGEVQEIAIEEYLVNAFPKDEVAEISKGVRGGDCVHVVKDDFGNECGRILYESKRTKAFSKDWIVKLKDDMRLKQAEIGVIVTEAMPGDHTRFIQIDGIWICSFAEFRSVSLLMRHTMSRIGEVIAAQDNKGDKMKLLYDYLTGNEFRQRVDAIREAFEQMNADLQKERSQAISNFAKREKQIFKVMENTVALYGEVRGIAGNAVQTIKALETDDNLQLKEAS